MGTKANPGEFDCYANAAPDEPMFVLLARDPIAPFLVSIWSSIRMDDIEAAQVKFNKMIKQCGGKYGRQKDVPKACEALDVMFEMFNYQAKQKGGWHGS